MDSDNSMIRSTVIPEINDSVTMIATAKNFLSPDECSKVISLCSTNLKKGTVTSFGSEVSKPSMRDSNVTFLSPNQNNIWLYEKLEKAILYMNKAYKYNLLAFHENLQVASYSKGGKFDSHIDIGSGKTSSRKLSMSIQLSDSQSYEGGNLEFMNTEQKTERSIGTLIVFPSFLQHRVTPVSSGLRYSLVAWVHGKPFS